MKRCTQIISWESWIKRSRFTRLVHLWPRNETEFRYARLPVLRFHIHSGNDDEKQRTCRTRSGLSEFRDYSIRKSRWEFRFPLNFVPKELRSTSCYYKKFTQCTTNQENGVRSYPIDFLLYIQYAETATALRGSHGVGHCDVQKYIYMNSGYRDSFGFLISTRKNYAIA